MEKHIPNLITVMFVVSSFFVLELLGQFIRPKTKIASERLSPQSNEKQKNVKYSPQFQMLSTFSASLGLIALILLNLSTEFSAWCSQGRCGRATLAIIVFLSISFVGLLYGRARGDLNWKGGGRGSP